MSLDNIKLSQQGRDQLIRLKRITGIKQWNILCRWALALSLRDASPPLVRDIVTDSPVDMDWKTFAGDHGELYLALLKQRSWVDEGSVTPETLSRTLTIHLHRGIGFLAGRRDLKTIEDMIRIAVPRRGRKQGTAA